jgi:hypothetical protein
MKPCLKKASEKFVFPDFHYFDMQLFSNEIWIVLQLVMDLLWLITIVYILRKLKAPGTIHTDTAEKTVKRVMNILTPLLKDAARTAEAFDRQIREKDRLIKRLNEKLDTRMISMNLLLNRMDAYTAAAAEPVTPPPASVSGLFADHDDINDQCRMILEYHRQGDTIETIARKLSIPAGEVKLVLDLKQKVADLEQKR